VGSDKPYLSNKIRTLYVKNEFTAIISARISLNVIWFLCPVLVYYELAAVPTKYILDPTVLSQRMLTTSLDFKCKQILTHEGQRNIITHLNAIHLNMMKLKFVI
jgi:hypothetical protein